jgi:hypothetical protein
MPVLFETSKREEMIKKLSAFYQDSSTAEKNKEISIEDNLEI